MEEELLKLIDLPEMVQRAAATPELAPLFRESELTINAIVAEIAPKLPDFVSIAVDSAAALQKLNLELAKLDQQRKEKLHELGKGPFAQLVIAYVLTVMILIGLGISAYYKQFWPGVPFRFIYALPIAILTLICAAAMHIRFWSYDHQKTELEYSYPGISDIKKQQDALQKQFRKLVYEKGIRPEVNGILSRATVPSYEMKLGNFTATGLSEIFTSAHEVETSARRNLDDLLKLPGGSIGLAGPRGAGKTTLMSLVANRPVREGKTPCSILCAAPVEYSGRDFLVTLFLLLCNWVLRDRKPRESRFPSDFPEQKPAPMWKLGLLSLARRLAGGLFLCGLFLALVGIELAIIKSSTIDSTKEAATSQQSGSTSHGSPPTSSGSNEQTHLTFQSFLKSLGLEPGTLLGWGLFMIVLSWMIHYIEPHVAFQMDPHFRVRRRPFPFSLFMPSRLYREKEYEEEERDSLRERASAQLDALRFQQSYTSGWSGALKLPFGIEGGVNNAQTLSSNQRSFPELVSDLRDFLQFLVVEYGRVTICIDELDKLESDDKAHLFLNEIKAIFGVSGVFYLVSVSENAISAFERRGLPFRDVFDSSFDTIVHVDYLTKNESKNLLKRRTTRIPEPFLCLCHCMSGGLPRDLIRTCRDLLNTADEEKVFDLMPLARRVITRESYSKARAMSIAVSKLPADLNQTQFLATLTNLLTVNLDEKSLLNQAAAILESADNLRSKISDITTDAGTREQLLQLSALAELETEFGLYLGYVATVLEVLCLVLSPQLWPAAETDNYVPPGITASVPPKANIFDRLSSTRQALAVSAAVGRQRLIEFRSELGLNISPIEITPPSQAPVAAAAPKN